MDNSVDDVLEFWFGIEARDHWFARDDEFDQKLAERYINLVGYIDGEIAQNGVSPWEGEPRGDLASLIVLDQFPRNIYRGTDRAYACDEKALALSLRAMSRKSDMALPEGQRMFAYLPLMHAEDIDMQELCVTVFAERLADRSNLNWAQQHFDIIKQFGRFPHRNDHLGRVSTPEELTYLAGGGFAG